MHCSIPLVCALLHALLASATPLTRRQQAVVSTSRGEVTGYDGGYETTRWTLRYATASRFFDPVRATSFDSDAAQLPPACAQSFYPSIQSTTEDCLFVNVYAPSDATSQSQLPVMVWVHGGSMLGGSATMPATDGSELARKQNMVVVTVQYRLGTFGFLKLDEASIHGNYGLKDIVKALEFVQEEIGAFGGDASRVLLAGHSSGAELIKSLMMAPSTSSLFHRVALHSPPLDLPAMTPTEGNAIGSLVAQALGCEPGNGALQACVFRKSTADLIAVTAALLSPSSSSYAGQVIGFPRAIEPLRPVVDGQLISADFADAVATGSVSNAKPAIFSFTHDEACPTIYSLAPAPVSEDYFPAYVYQLVGSSRAQAVLASGLYAPDGTADSTRASLIDLGTDLIWRCVATQSAYNLSSSVDVYMAEFDSGITWDLNDGAASLCEDRVSHGDDLYALFGRSSSSADFGETFERDIPLSQLIRKEVQARWAAFARGGSPNSPDFAEQWTTVDGELSLLQLGDTSGRPQATGQMQANKHAQACGLTTGLWGNIVPFDSST